MFYRNVFVVHLFSDDLCFVEHGSRFPRQTDLSARNFWKRLITASSVCLNISMFTLTFFKIKGVTFSSTSSNALKICSFSICCCPFACTKICACWRASCDFVVNKLRFIALFLLCCFFKFIHLLLFKPYTQC